MKVVVTLNNIVDPYIYLRGIVKVFPGVGHCNTYFKVCQGMEYLS